MKPVNPAARRRLAIVAGGLLAAALAASGLLHDDYLRFLVGAVAFNAITILSISLLAGSCGIWSLGHTAFIAIGAYVSANMAAAGFPLEVILPAVVLLSAAVGYALGITAGRFSILYFGLLTLAVALTTGEIVGRFADFTGGDQGLTVAPMKSWLAGRPLLPADAPLVGIVLATLLFLVADVVVKGTPGRRWRAVKSQRIASTALGLAPHLANANAFAFSAALAAVGGVATALTLGFLDPHVFDLRSGIMLIVGTVVGGIGSFAGAVVGALFIVGVPEAGRAVPDMAAFALGLAMMLVLLVLPRGIAPALLDLLPARGRPASGASGPLAADAVAGLARELMPACDKPLLIEKLSVAFGGLQVLHDVSLVVPPGRTLGLIGPNGAGKTTLINVLSGFVQPSSCEALDFGGVHLLRTRAQARLGHGLGRSFQHGELFDDLTVRETLLVAASRRKDGGRPAQLVERVLEVLQLKALADSLPQELPFGVRKVCDIARMLVAGASFVALDEPFSGLDRAEAAELRALLAGMKSAGVSILIIDHAVQEVLDLADEVLVLNFGTVLARGTPREISQDTRVQEAYFGKAAAALREEVAHG